MSASAPSSPVVARRDGGAWGGLLGALVVVGVWGLVAVTVAGRELSAPPAPLAAAIVFLPFFYGAAGVCLFAAWSALPDRRSLPVALLLLTVTAAALWGPSAVRHRATGDGPDVRVMSWNVRRLWGGPDDGGDALGCAVVAIEHQAPDVIALLEVSADDVATLSDRLGLSCAHHPYGEGGGDKVGGLATCTRGERWRLASGSGQRFVDDQDWFYVLSEIESGGRVFNLLAVHLYPYTYVGRRLKASMEGLRRGETEPLSELSSRGQQVVRGQSDQARALLERVDRLQDPTLLAGDFNSTRDSALHGGLRRSLNDSFERAGRGNGATVRLFDWIPLRVDYVYASPSFGIRNTTVPDVGCSDHRPVVTDLVLTP